MTNTFVRMNGNNTKERNENDFYPTPPYVTEALLKVEAFEGLTLEPACGDGAISKVLLDNLINVVSSDLFNYGFGETGKNFLNVNTKVSNIITNPPFKIALEFIEHAKKITENKIAFLLKTNFLETSKRYPMFQDKVFPFARLYQFSKRISFGQYAGTHTQGGMLSFSWFIWDRSHKGPPQIFWLTD